MNIGWQNIKPNTNQMNSVLTYWYYLTIRKGLSQKCIDVRKSSSIIHYISTSKEKSNAHINWEITC